MNYKCYIMNELTFLKELMLIRLVNQKSVKFVTIVIFQIKHLRLIEMSPLGVMMY